jgi:PAS domain-containing protein
LSPRELLEALPAAVCITDALGRLAYLSAAAVEMVGRKSKIGGDHSTAPTAAGA